MHSLTKAAEAYKIAYGAYPVTLQAMVYPPGGKPYVEAEHLLDPWAKPYYYDASGPRNQGKRPDIWCETPDGEVIGNWMLKKK